MRAFLVVGAALFATFWVSQVTQAATVASIQGEVLINSGEGFKPITGTLGDVKAGGMVMVRPGGLATITYASNCSVRVPSGVWAIQASAPCAAGKEAIDFSTRMNEETPPPEDGFWSKNGVWIVGGVVVAGGVTAGILLSQNHHNNPTSP